MQKLKFLKNKKQKILVVAAHPDDEILGCGGSIIKFQETHDIEVIFMTDGVSSRGKNKTKALRRRKNCIDLFSSLKLKKPTFFNFPDNQIDKIPLLTIVKKLEKKIKSFKPHTIFTHYSGCLNIDHRRTFEAVMTASRPLSNSSVKKILSFEILSSTEWAQFKNESFQPNYFINISKEFKQKIKCLNFYKSEICKYPHSRSLKAVEALARFRGISSGNKYAEAFYLNRYIKD
jgi:N-acetylglucosamine malate deacetylase 1